MSLNEFEAGFYFHAGGEGKIGSVVSQVLEICAIQKGQTAQTAGAGNLPVKVKGVR